MVDITTFGPGMLVLSVLGACLMSSVYTLVGVALGGWLVFRTKKEAHERLFSAKPPQGEAFVLDPFDESGLAQPLKPKGVPAGEEVDRGAETLDRMTSKFLDQMKMERAVAEQEGAKE